MVDQRSRDVIQRLEKCVGAQGDCPDAGTDVAQMLWRITRPERRSVRHVRLLRSAATHLQRGDGVRSERKMGAVLLARTDRDEDDVRALEEPIEVWGRKV